MEYPVEKRETKLRQLSAIVKLCYYQIKIIVDKIITVMDCYDFSGIFLCTDFTNTQLKSFQKKSGSSCGYYDIKTM